MDIENSTVRSNDILLGEIKGKLDMLIRATDTFHVTTSEKIDKMGKKIARLEVKSGVWGGISGIITTTMFMLALHVKKFFGWQ